MGTYDDLRVGIIRECEVTVFKEADLTGYREHAYETSWGDDTVIVLRDHWDGETIVDSTLSIERDQCEPVVVAQDGVIRDLALFNQLQALFLAL